MSPFTDLPIEILQDNLFPHLPARALLNLTCTSKFFAVLCSDDAVWRRKLASDFNYSGAGTARTSGWKVIYRGMHKPKVYVWGDTANGRLGALDLPKSSVYGVPFPFQLRFPKTRTRVVSLSAGGMSFYALDSEGSIHVWGTLDGSTPVLNSDGFSEAGKKAETPHKLLLPSPIRTVSCGRLHASALDQNNKVWNFVNWGRPFRLDAPVLQDVQDPLVQVESGWGFSSALTESGQIYVWWPFVAPLAQIIEDRMQEMNADPNNKALPTEDHEIQCSNFIVDSSTLSRLPGLPTLPVLTMTGEDIDRGIPPKIIQIAGLEHYLVAITDQGHVLKFGNLDSPPQVTTGHGTWEWTYLPNFCDLNFIRRQELFSDQTVGAPLAAPDVMKITHVTGNFRHFVVYSTGSSSLVLIGENSATAESKPDIKRELQHRSVISVAIGDWHNAALTADGKVFTWGEFSSGALGLGDPAKLPPGTPGAYPAADNGHYRRRPPPVDTPTQVKFDYGTREPRDRFAFAITAAGWHTGALVMDLNPDGEEEDVYEMDTPDRPLNASDLPQHPHINPPILPFRVGGAHLSIFRGLGRGRGG